MPGAWFLGLLRHMNLLSNYLAVLSLYALLFLHYTTSGVVLDSYLLAGLVDAHACLSHVV